LKIDAIELVGEATRMPYVDQEIKDHFYMFNKDTQRTMNTLEAIANGCAIQAKILTDPDFFSYKL